MIVRWVLVKIFNLIGNKDVLFYLFEVFLEDDDLVVFGLFVGVMVIIGLDVMDLLFGIFKNLDCILF